MTSNLWKVRKPSSLSASQPRKDQHQAVQDALLAKQRATAAAARLLRALRRRAGYAQRSRATSRFGFGDSTAALGIFDGKLSANMSIAAAVSSEGAPAAEGASEEYDTAEAKFVRAG